MTEPVAAEGTSRTLIILLGVLGGVVVLGALWFFVISPLLLSEDIDEPIVRAPSPPAEVPQADPEPEPTPVPETFEVFTARDPFQQLATPIVTTPGDPSAPTAPGAPTAPTAPRDPTAPPADPTAPRDPGAPPPDAEVGATRVRLVDVFVDDNGAQKVLVTVNGSGYEVAAGEQFADRFRVLDISPPCATFLFGDSRFVLCMGEEIRK